LDNLASSLESITGKAEDNRGESVSHALIGKSTSSMPIISRKRDEINATERGRQFFQSSERGFESDLDKSVEIRLRSASPGHTNILFLPDNR
jgi:hypothetical protein